MPLPPSPAVATAFCRTCGRIVGQGAVACPGCGHAPAAGTSFCNHCGAATQPGQIACLSCGYALGTYAVPSAKNKVTAGLLGIFLGALGIHKFYLGYHKAGAIMLVVCLVGGFFFGLGTLAAAIVGLIEGIMYLSRSDAEFAATYVTGKKEWF